MINIRKLTIDDIEDYKSIRLELLRNHPENFGSDAEEESRFEESMWIKRLKNVNADSYGIYDGDDIVGVSVLVRNPRSKMRHFGTINSVYVKPSHRKAGLAKQVLLKIIDDANDYGLEFLRLSVVTTNQGAYKLYESLGFESYGIEKGSIKVNGIYSDQYLMQKPLK